MKLEFTEAQKTLIRLAASGTPADDRLFRRVCDGIRKRTLTAAEFDVGMSVSARIGDGKRPALRVLKGGKV